MARVNATEVKEIMDNCQVDNYIVETFINGANALVTKVFTNDTVMTDALLKEVERWFTAHLIACSKERQAQSQTVENASVRYTGYYSMGLDSTSYGQTVKMFDITGKFAAFLGKQQASMYAVKIPS